MSHKIIESNEKYIAIDEAEKEQFLAENSGEWLAIQYSDDSELTEEAVLGAEILANGKKFVFVKTHSKEKEERVPVNSGIHITIDL